MSRTSDVVVVGGGVIGLAVAWRAAQQGWAVTVCDPAPGTGASWAAAGMLAPVAEARPEEAPLTSLALASLRRWPGFAAELEDETGLEVGLRSEGTMSVAFDADDQQVLGELVVMQRSLGLEAEWLDRTTCRQLEPGLHPSISGGAIAPGDHQVDNRALLAALLVAAERRRVRLCRQAVRTLDTAGGRMLAVTCDDGTRFTASRFVLAAGCHSALLPGLPALPVRPVKGQILRLRGDPASPVIARTVRAVVHGRPVYLVPRRGGEVVVGASMEERGFDTTVTAGVVRDLLEAAVAVVPDVAELELTEMTARLRPGTPDNGPLLGTTMLEGLLLATGHYRHGILLAPVTADALTDALACRRLPEEAAPFAPGRFG